MPRFTKSRLALAAGLSTLLAACGGGGGSSGPDVPTPTPQPLSLSGKAAIGAALAGATVTAQCASGTGTATTGSDGSYSLSISNGALPCVLTAAGTDAHGAAVSLHSVATTGTAQITSLTELLLAQVTGAEPALLTSSTNIAGLATTFSTAAVAAAQTQLLTLLGDAGIDTTAIASTNLVTGTLVAGSGSGYDGVLDSLHTALGTGGSTLSSLTTSVATQVAAASGAGSTSSSSEQTASALAPELLLKAASATCSALRSTEYRVLVSAQHGGALAHLRMDAVGNSLTDLQTGEVHAFTANGSCRYTLDTGADVVVSPAGVLVVRLVADDGSHPVGIGIPVQSHTPAELAGDWNVIITDTSSTGTGWIAGRGVQRISVSGDTVTAQFQKGCQYEIGTVTPDCFTSTEADPAPVRPVTLDTSDGGLVMHSAASNDGGPWADKSYAYRAGNGEWFTIGSNIYTATTTGDGSIAFGTRSRTLSLPTVGSVSTNWNIYMDMSTQLSLLSSDVRVHTVLSVDSATGGYVRSSGVEGGATHSEAMSVNSPYDGFVSRDGALGVAVSDGSTTTVRPSAILRVPGMGVSVALQTPLTGGPQDTRLVFAVAKP